MGADAQERRLSLHPTSRAQDHLAIRGVLPAAGQVGQPTGQALDSEQLDHLEAGVDRLASEFVGVVKEGRGKPARPAVGVAVLPVAEIPLNHPAEVGFNEELARVAAARQEGR